ncbi:hypothetical protein N7539_007925 [Penicillium diatomitis]|uniref:Uncharacterized protein n=1 Tax=Penicillium diatomitis TaxID=2819901 RepID=A0A9W9WUC2_9EURO|nr:uncharacterized protein N7539_007925 [Penicillium diatomitis]KAJ5475638.1 hypothetical protein N7539_007925 [Penicillium diatomitis]
MRRKGHLKQEDLEPSNDTPATGVWTGAIRGRRGGGADRNKKWPETPGDTHLAAATMRWAGTRALGGHSLRYEAETDQVERARFGVRWERKQDYRNMAAQPTRWGEGGIEKGGDEGGDGQLGSGDPNEPASLSK